MQKIRQGLYTYDVDTIVDSYLKFFDESGYFEDLSPEELSNSADYFLAIHFYSLITSMDQRISDLNGYKKERLSLVDFYNNLQDAMIP